MSEFLTKVIVGKNGERYDYAVATRDNDYLLVYNHTGRPMEIDLTKIADNRKNVWWDNPQNGKYDYVGEFENKATFFCNDAAYGRGEDRVLVAVEASKNYVE